MNFKSRTILILFVAISISSYAQLSKTEKAVLKSVETNYKESVAFLEKTVNINSGTYNTAGVRKVGALYKQFLDQLGFSTRWIEMPTDMHRAGHLIGEIKGKKGKRLLLLGHMDTVFEPESGFLQWKQTDSIATGPGTVDMKGGNLIMLFALKALKDAGLLEDRQVIVVLHGDEESAGDPIEDARKDLVDAAKRSDIALCFESGTGFNTATVARRGSTTWTLTTTGKEGHSSGIFSASAGAGAIYESSRVLNRFYNELQEKYLTHSPGIILGGMQVSADSSVTQGTASGKANIISDHVIVRGDLRCISEEQYKRICDKMRAIVAASLPGTQSEISFGESYPSMPPTDGNMALLARLSKVGVDLGQGAIQPYDPGLRGAGDISFIAQYLDCLDGLGPSGAKAHVTGEYVELKTLLDVEKRAAIFIHRLTTEKPLSLPRK